MADPQNPPDTGNLNQQEKDIAFSVEKSVTSMLHKMFEIKLEDKALVAKANVIKWMGRLNLIMPYGYRFVSVLLYRLGPRKSIHHVDGFIVMYFPESIAEQLIKMMDRSPKDIDDILDGLGELCNIVAGGVKVNLTRLGYKELDVTVPLSFQVEVDELFDYTGDEKLEISFTREELPFLRVDIAIKPECLIKVQVPPPDGKAAA